MLFPAGNRKGRDVTFVPVSINYDRVLEDYILARRWQARPEAVWRQYLSDCAIYRRSNFGYG